MNFPFTCRKTYAIFIHETSEKSAKLDFSIKKTKDTPLSIVDTIAGLSIGIINLKKHLMRSDFSPKLVPPFIHNISHQ